MDKVLDENPMKRLLITFDLEEFDLIENRTRLSDKEKNEISYKGLKAILHILRKNDMQCTFFTTSLFAEYHFRILNELVEQGHEIAFHGYRDRHDYKVMDEKKSFHILKKSKQFLEDKVNVKVKGFRAPRLRAPNFKILRKIGIKYDSSFHPTYLLAHPTHLSVYNSFAGIRKPFLKENIRVIPISTTPVLRLPFSWIWFRNLGLNYAKICTKACLIDQEFINIYFHPWDFVDLTKFDLPTILSRNTGKKIETMLDNYISWCKQIGLKDSTVRSYILEAE